ncbi:MAG: hypothetical protein K0S55_1766 [Clostridia bacterium]|nr:hypothetical protein [Clostridia bacterium]
MWYNACQKSYKRCYQTFLRTIHRFEGVKKPEKKSQEYQRTEYPGQKIQIDVKYVPADCIANEQK